MQAASSHCSVYSSGGCAPKSSPADLVSPSALLWRNFRGVGYCLQLHGTLDPRPIVHSLARPVSKLVATLRLCGGPVMMFSGAVCQFTDRLEELYWVNRFCDVQLEARRECSVAVAGLSVRCQGYC